MPEGTFSQVVVLCEDRVHFRFIAAWLVKHCQIQPRAIREQVAPSGRNAGEQFVRESFPAEVKAFRRRVASVKGTMLIAVIDADALDTLQRRRQMNSDPPLACGEQVYVFIPKWNIETWIRFLNGRPANETASFKQSKDNGEIRDAAEKFLEYVRGVTEPALPSLAEGVEEARRMPRDHR